MRGSLDRHLPRTAPGEEELFAMRRAAWRKQGIVVIRPADVRDAIIRQALINEAIRLWTKGSGVMANRKQRTPTTRLAGGLPVIRRPGDVLEPVYEADPDGRPVVHHRTVDTLGIMLRSGTISQDMHDAARDFQAQFTIARFDAIRCMPLMRLPGGSGPGDFTDAQVDAHRRVGSALDALGGLGGPAGSCIWHVVGLQRSIREWALRQGWGGRPVRVEQAQGILVAALGVFARYDGNQRGGRVGDASFCNGAS